jgi:Tfp pilus assembly protein PilV
MNTKLIPHKNQKGFGLIEILIVGAVIAIGFVSIAAFLVYSSGLTFRVTRNTEAVSLAEEGMEAVRSMRDESWSANIAVLTSGTTYYPEVSGNKWTLTTIKPGLVNGLYNRTVVIGDVNRDANDDIAPSGTPDVDTKEVVVKVSWNENQVTKDVTLTTYITNFLSN